MPLYEYRCKKCGTCFEQLVSLADRDTGIECPQCGAKRPDRLLSSFAVGKAKTTSAAAGAGSCATCPTGTCPL